MIYSGSLISITEGTLEIVKTFLIDFPQLDVYSVSDDKQNIVVAIEEENDETLEDLCKKITSHPDIINIAHHYFHFEDEVDKAVNEGIAPDLKGFGKKKFKKIMDEKEQNKS